MKWLETEETVRFNEVDQWGIAWYGNYMAWFEVGRMALLREVNLLPEHMVELGYIAPVINLKCDFKQPARCMRGMITEQAIQKRYLGESKCLLRAKGPACERDSEYLARYRPMRLAQR